jgi:hypothetical protein
VADGEHSSISIQHRKCYSLVVSRDIVLSRAIFDETINAPLALDRKARLKKSLGSALVLACRVVEAHRYQVAALSPTPGICSEVEPIGDGNIGGLFSQVHDERFNR